MKINYIKISNILGIEELEFQPGESVTVISGPNGSGKTSVLESIKATIKTAHDATLLRKGADKGEVVLVLEDGRSIRRRVTENTSSIDLLDENGKKTSKPVEAIRAITDLLSVNPVDFLRATKKDRARVLIESMPLEADAARLSKIVGFDVRPSPGVHALQVVDGLHKQIYDDRSGTNRAIKEKRHTIDQLHIALPEAPAGVQGNEAELEARIQQIDEAKRAELDRISEKLESLRKENQEKIDALKEEMAKTERLAAAQREKSLNRFADERAPVSMALQAIRDDRNRAAKREQTLAMIKQMEEDAATLTGVAERQNKTLSDLEAYKIELLAGLPIPGVEIRDGEIYRNDVPFDRLNTAQQVDIAVEVAKLRAGELGIVCVDGLELLDSGSFEEFRQRAAESDLQLFVTRVSDENFSIDNEA